jgi:hypothetical protein
MKSANEVEVRVRELLGAELKRRLSRERLPCLCVHNHQQPLDYRKSVYGEVNHHYNRISREEETPDGARVTLPVVQKIGLCMLGSESVDSWQGTICDEPIDAQRCPYFEFKEARSQVYEGFVSDVSDPAYVEASLPAVHSLLWVLGQSLHLKAGASVWEKVRRLFSRPPVGQSVSVAVYLPTLDGWTDQDSAGAGTPHGTASSTS